MVKFLSLLLLSFTLFSGTVRAQEGDGKRFLAKGQAVVLTEKNSVILRGEVTSQSVGESILRLEATATAQKDAAPTYLVIDSPGGSIIDGMELVNYLKSTDHNIECVAKTAISMAFVILQSCPVRNAVDDAILMQHVAAYGVQGREPNNYTFTAFLRSLVNKLDGDQAKRIGLTLKAFRDLTIRDWWTVGQEAKDANVVDNIGKYKCSSELFSKIVTKEVPTMFGSVKVNFSACPLVGVPMSATMKLFVGKEPSAESEKAKQDALEKFDTHGAALKQMNAK